MTDSNRPAQPQHPQENPQDLTAGAGLPQQAGPSSHLESPDSSPKLAVAANNRTTILAIGCAVIVLAIVAFVAFSFLGGSDGKNAEAYAPQSYVEKTHDDKGNPEPCSIPPEILSNLQVTNMSPGFNTKYQIRFCDGSLPKVQVKDEDGTQRNQSVRFSVSFLPQKLVDSDNGIRTSLERFQSLSAAGLSSGWEVHQGPSDAGLEYCSYYWPTEKGRLGLYLGAGGNCTAPSPQLTEVMKFVESY